MMNSRILSRVEFDGRRLGDELGFILEASPPAEDYSEYRFGTFHTYVLRSPEGKDDDGLFRGLRGEARPTALGGSLAHINEVVDATFHTRRLQMMRAYLLQDALLIPHRDYVEFKEDARRMARLHVPLLTNPRALHSEEEAVFHMRVGEVWLLDVTQIHAACNASSAPRLSLVLDFVLDGAPLESVFRRPPAGGGFVPAMVTRPPLPAGFADGVRALGAVLCEENFRDVVQLLSRVHFYRHADAGRFFDWLDDACRASGQRALVEKAEQLRAFLVASRELGQRFAL